MSVPLAFQPENKVRRVQFNDNRPPTIRNRGFTNDDVLGSEFRHEVLAFSGGGGAAYAAPPACAVFFAAFPFATTRVGFAFDGFRPPFFFGPHFVDLAFGVFFAVRDTA